jgi:DNA adenine methylase
MRYFSPLRYPGGKAWLVDFLANVIELNQLDACQYYEAYAGGGGAALGLLMRGSVGEIHLNDADPRIFAFWKAVLEETERFINRLLTVPLTLEEWENQHSICSDPSQYDQFDIGFAAFFLNRCNRSGVITGAGPIGGYEQTGKWKLDARFNRYSLVERIALLSKYQDRIHLSCKDAIEFLKTSLPVGRGRAQVLAYLDPPYVNNGQRLYLNAYSRSDHARLERYLSRQKTLHWIVSYDDSELVRYLYRLYSIKTLSINYSLQKKRSAKELLISSEYLAIPCESEVYLLEQDKLALQT